MPTVRDPASTPYERLTPRQYLVRERAAEHRSEYFDGQVVAMAGGTPRHGLIAQNIAAHLYFRLPSGCGVYQADVKVQVGTGSAYAYPDVLVLCGEPRYLDRTQDVVTNPAVVFEVLSPGTEARDRTVKAAAYRLVPSLAAYVLVSQKDPRVEVYARGAGGAWECTVYQRLPDTVRLDALGCELSLAEIYRNVHPAG
jgi:Uma2 family endonuclease